MIEDHHGRPNAPGGICAVREATSCTTGRRPNSRPISRALRWWWTCVTLKVKMPCHLSRHSSKNPYPCDRGVPSKHPTLEFYQRGTRLLSKAGPAAMRCQGQFSRSGWRDGVLTLHLTEVLGYGYGSEYGCFRRYLFRIRWDHMPRSATGGNRCDSLLRTESPQGAFLIKSSFPTSCAVKIQGTREPGPDSWGGVFGLELPHRRAARRLPGYFKIPHPSPNSATVCIQPPAIRNKLSG